MCRSTVRLLFPSFHSISLLLAITVLHASSAASELTISAPNSVTPCSSVKITWVDGVPPFRLHFIALDASGAQLNDTTHISEQDQWYLWTANFPGATAVQISVDDSNLSSSSTDISLYPPLSRSCLDVLAPGASATTITTISTTTRASISTWTTTASVTFTSWPSNTTAQELPSSINLKTSAVAVGAVGAVLLSTAILIYFRYRQSRRRVRTNGESVERGDGVFAEFDDYDEEHKPQIVSRKSSESSFTAGEAEQLMGTTTPQQQDCEECPHQPLLGERALHPSRYMSSHQLPLAFAQLCRFPLASVRSVWSGRGIVRSPRTMTFPRALSPISERTEPDSTRTRSGDSLPSSATSRSSTGGSAVTTVQNVRKSETVRTETADSSTSEAARDVRRLIRGPTPLALSPTGTLIPGGDRADSPHLDPEIPPKTAAQHSPARVSSVEDRQTERNDALPTPVGRIAPPGGPANARLMKLRSQETLRTDTTSSSDSSKSEAARELLRLIRGPTPTLLTESPRGTIDLHEHDAPALGNVDAMSVIARSSPDPNFPPLEPAQVAPIRAVSPPNSPPNSQSNSGTFPTPAKIRPQGGAVDARLMRLRSQETLRSDSTTSSASDAAREVVRLIRGPSPLTLSPRGTLEPEGGRADSPELDPGLSPVITVQRVPGPALSQSPVMHTFDETPVVVDGRSVITLASPANHAEQGASGNSNNLLRSRYAQSDEEQPDVGVRLVLPGIPSQDRWIDFTSFGSAARTDTSYSDGTLPPPYAEYP